MMCLKEENYKYVKTEEVFFKKNLYSDTSVSIYWYLWYAFGLLLQIENRTQSFNLQIQKEVYHSPQQHPEACLILYTGALQRQKVSVAIIMANLNVILTPSYYSF